MAYNLFGRYENYGGGFGSAKKENIMNISASWIDQQIFPIDMAHMRTANDGASQFLTHRQYTGSQARDMAMDAKNPRQELPKNPSDVRNIEEIPQWDPQEIDMSTPMDYTAHDSVRMMQESSNYHSMQENLFTDSKLLDHPELNTDKVGNTVHGLAQNDVFNSKFEGSAAGKINNHLWDEDIDGSKLNTISSDSAF